MSPPWKELKNSKVSMEIMMISSGIKEKEKTR